LWKPAPRCGENNLEVIEEIVAISARADREQGKLQIQKRADRPDRPGNVRAGGGRQMIRIYRYGEVKNEEIFARAEPSVNVEGIVADILADVRKKRG
jgi:hypothetical protein